MCRYSLAGVLLERAQRAKQLPHDCPDYEVRLQLVTACSLTEHSAALTAAQGTHKACLQVCMDNVMILLSDVDKCWPHATHISDKRPRPPQRPAFSTLQVSLALSV